MRSSETMERAPDAAPLRIAAVAAALAFAAAVVGAVVRVTGAGLACPDWPTCFGTLAPPGWGPALIEFSHRVVAGSLAAGVYWLAVAAWRHERARMSKRPANHTPARWLRAVSLLAAALVTVQAALGGLNVLTELSPAVGAAHVALATGLTGLLVAAYVLARWSSAWDRPGATRGAAADPARRRYRWSVAGAAGAFVVVAMGGVVRATGASLACTDWPLCRGLVWPEGAWPVWLQWGHRALAFSLGVLLLAGAVRVGGRLWAAFGLYVVQVGIGALGVLTLLSPAVRVLHLGTAVALVAVLSAEATTGGLALVSAPRVREGRRAHDVPV